MAGSATPTQRYEAGIVDGQWQNDPAQRGVLEQLDRIHAALLEPRPARKRGLVGRLIGHKDRSPAAIEGLYVWGGVGRGKTFLIDLFFQGLPQQDITASLIDAAQPRPGGETGSKLRVHFHRFMRVIHEQLRAHAGESDPMANIVGGWSRAGLRILVLDEFFVSDIGDAMLLAKLLEHMFSNGVSLVATSNVDPVDLYRDGLQRASFLPAIDLLRRNCHVLHMESQTDYRLRALTRSPVYRSPIDEDSQDWLAGRWEELGGGPVKDSGSIEIEGRMIPIRARANGMAWFEFESLCEGPRSANDYIEIAREFHTLLVGNIPALDDQRNDAARRFITLIDEVYDRHVNLVCTADTDPLNLYAGQRQAHAFERTTSRLIEMRSAEYLATEHRP